ncbi:MAG: hypothetical protein ACOVP1_00585 [Bacteroidia bacterium]
MKTLKPIFLILFVLQLGLVSCKKHLVEKYEEIQSAKAKKFAELSPSKSFKWSSMNSIAISFPSLPNDVRVSTLKVTDVDGNVYFQKLHKASDPLNHSIEVPAHIESLKMTFGGIKKEINITSGKMEIELK